MKDVLDSKCHECQSYYDAEHHQECSYRKTSRFVTYNHVDLDEEETDAIDQRDTVKAA